MSSLTALSSLSGTSDTSLMTSQSWVINSKLPSPVVKTTISQSGLHDIAVIPVSMLPTHSIYNINVRYKRHDADRARSGRTLPVSISTVMMSPSRVARHTDCVSGTYVKATTLGSSLINDLTEYVNGICTRT